MRFIYKGTEPAAFATWRASGNDDWQPTYSGMSGPIKDAVRNALLAEQGHVCCYCERRVSAQLASSHIEHLVSQTAAPAKALDFGNLLCSCNTHSIHCGAKKADKALLVHPLLQDCDRHFAFGSSGDIAPSDAPDQAAARTAIAVLGLAAPALAARRRQALHDWLLLTRDLAPAEMLASVKVLLGRDPEGRFVPHASSVAFVLRAAAR